MKVKRYFISILLIIALNICGCGRMGSISFMNGGADKIADETLETLIDAIENEDKETIKKLFAEDALAQIEDIDSEIEEFIKFYEGTLENWDDLGTVACISSSGDEGYYQHLEGFYKIVTSEEKYRIIFILNQSAPEKSHEGIYEIGIIKEDIYDEKRQEFGSDVPGLYIVE